MSEYLTVNLSSKNIFKIHKPNGACRGFLIIYLNKEETGRVVYSIEDGKVLLNWNQTPYNEDAINRAIEKICPNKKEVGGDFKKIHPRLSILEDKLIEAFKEVI